jgi:aerotaxis receptor
MPAAAFADMWRTIQSGGTWSALVKNRRSDGDHYWVRANVTPIRCGDEIVGFLSVRTKADGEQVRWLEPLYQAWSAGRLRGWAMRQGRVLRGGWQGWWDALRHQLTVARRLYLGLTLVMGTALIAIIEPAWREAALPAVLLSGLLVAWWWHVSVLLPLRDVLVQARRVASGQRSENTLRDRCDELGALMHGVEQAGLNLEALGQDIESQVSDVRAAVEAMQEGHLDLYGCTGRATEQLGQTSQALQALEQTIETNQGAVRALRTLTGETDEAAQQGMAMMARTGETMQAIARSGQRVADISSMIDSIAFQTNILALNAAVEAASAGEHGRGFAVVAAEVRSLSRQSAEAAGEIRTLIQATHDQIMKRVEVVTQAEASMDQILGMVSRVAALVRDIDGATDLQGDGVAQVRDCVVQLEGVTRQNGELAEAGAAATMSLLELCRQLGEAVAVYRLGSAGAAGAFAEPQAV